MLNRYHPFIILSGKVHKFIAENEAAEQCKINEA